MNVNRTKTLSINVGEMFESRISALQLKNTRERNFDAKTVAWSYGMDGHANQVRGAVLRTGKQKDRAVVHRFNALLG